MCEIFSKLTIKTTQSDVVDKINGGWDGYICGKVVVNAFFLNSPPLRLNSGYNMKNLLTFLTFKPFNFCDGKSPQSCDGKSLQSCKQMKYQDNFEDLLT